MKKMEILVMQPSRIKHMSTFHHILHHENNTLKDSDSQQNERLSPMVENIFKRLI